MQTDIARISNAIKTNKFSANQVLKEAFTKARAYNSAVHLIGLMSDGNVHSSPENLFSLLRMAKNEGVKEVFLFIRFWTGAMLRRAQRIFMSKHSK